MKVSKCQTQQVWKFISLSKKSTNSNIASLITTEHFSFSFLLRSLDRGGSSTNDKVRFWTFWRADFSLILGNFWLWNFDFTWWLYLDPDWWMKASKCQTQQVWTWLDLRPFNLILNVILTLIPFCRLWCHDATPVVNMHASSISPWPYQVSFKVYKSLLYTKAIMMKNRSNSDHFDALFLELFNPERFVHISKSKINVLNKH